MIDHSRPPAAPACLPEFAPVPRRRARHDGWTADRQRRFIESLAETGSVKSAAHAVNMTPEGAYMLRRHPAADSFRAAWDAALALGIQRLEDVALDRALNGTEVPIVAYGKVIGTRRVFNDALLMFLLRNRAPTRFAADAANPPDAPTQTSLNRLKRQWRAEWEAERRAEAEADEAEVLAELDAKLARMREREREIAAELARQAAEGLPAPESLSVKVEARWPSAMRPEDVKRVSTVPPPLPPMENARVSAAEAHAREWQGHLEAGRLGGGASEQPAITEEPTPSP